MHGGERGKYSQRAGRFSTEVKRSVASHEGEKCPVCWLCNLEVAPQEARLQFLGNLGDASAKRPRQVAFMIR